MKKLIALILSVILSVSCLSITTSADIATEELAQLFRSKLDNYETEVDIYDYTSRYRWSVDETVNEVIASAYFANPDLFYVDNKFNYTADLNGYVHNVVFSFTMNASERAAAKKKIDAAVNKVLAGITDDMNDVDKALYVHDYLVLNCKYGAMSQHTMYDCLVGKKAVCQGYSLAYEYIMRDCLGIDCTVVFSRTQNHMWNYLKIGNKWYHVDLTLDDPGTSYNGTTYDMWGLVLHKNFLMSDAQCRENSVLHTGWTVSGGYGAASDKSYDKAFWKDVRAKICLIDGKYYYAKDTGKDSSSGQRMMTLYSFNKNTGKAKALLKTKSRWYSRRVNGNSAVAAYGSKVYTTGYLSLDYYGGKLYFNTNKSVYSYDLNTGKTKKVYTLNKGEEKQIFGLVTVGNYVRLAYKDDLTYAEKYISLKMK
ncbi:MAG: hypothetical protein II820_10605 [Ruminiclostridium sp.]|nr:hypothetical protein [Ruminiclostridium sp.]